MRKNSVILLLVLLCTALAGKSYRLETLYDGSYDNPVQVHSNSIWVCITDTDKLNVWELQESGQLVRAMGAGYPEGVWGVQDAAVAPGDSTRFVDIWLASNAGVWNYSGLKWKNYGDISADQLEAGPNGEIWLIANGTLLKHSAGQFAQAVSDREWQTRVFGISCFTLDRQGFPWIGMMGPAIIRFNGTELDNWLGVPTGPPTDEPGQDDSAPKNLCFDSNNNPWVDYPLGAACWINGAWVEHDLTGYGFEWGVSHLATDDQGIIWASNGGDRVLCFDGEEWYVPEIQGGDFTPEGAWIADMITGPNGSMLFEIASEGDFGAYIKVYICQSDLESRAEPKAEISQSVQRSYPPPVPLDPSSREAQGLKGPVKSVFSQQISLPTYFSYQEFHPDGKLKLRSQGRTSMNSETTYWYDDRGNVIREQRIEYGNGQELDNYQILHEYEYDTQGYPLRKTSKTAAGEMFTIESFTYSDSGYVKEWQTEPNDYSPGYAYRESYDNQGRINSWTSKNLSDGTLDKRENAYMPDTNQKYEWTEWNGSGYNRKRLVTLNPQGQEGSWILYDGAGNVLTQYSETLNAHGDIVSSVYADKTANSTSRTSTKYTYDSCGNPLSVESTIDGQPDEQGSNTFTYEYY